MTSTTFRISTVSVMAAGALVAACAPSAFAEGGQGAPQVAARAATAVEKATGTGDILPAPAVGTAAPAAPLTSDGELKVSGADGSTIGIALPHTAGVVGVASGSGTVVYPDAVDSASVAVQPTTADGVRALVVIADASAPREYRYALNLPDGAGLQRQDDGSFTVVKDGRELGSFQTPWAKDANGDPVATEYRVQDGALIQSVAFDDNTTFPIVADPTWKGFEKRVENALVGSDQSTVAGAAAGCITGAIGAAGVGCGPGAAVGAIGGFAKGAIEGFLKKPEPEKTHPKPQGAKTHPKPQAAKPSKKKA